MSNRSRCGAVLILRSPAQPSDRCRCDAVLMLIIKDILRRDYDKQIFPKRSLAEILPKELLHRAPTEISERDLAKILYRDLAKRRPLLEILCRNFTRRPLNYRDLVQGAGEEDSDLVHRSL